MAKTPSARDSGWACAIADRIARLLDAPLHLRSHAGIGSVFALSVPQVAEAQARPPRGGAKAGLHDADMLVVDNDPRALDALTADAGRLGLPWSAALRTDATRTGPSRSGRPHLWLFDFHLDDGDTGVALRERLQQRFDARPTLILSADQPKPCGAPCSRRACRCLPKPLKPLALKSVLDRLLAGRLVQRSDLRGINP